MKVKNTWKGNPPIFQLFTGTLCEGPRVRQERGRERIIGSERRARTDPALLAEEHIQLFSHDNPGTPGGLTTVT